MNNMNFDPCIFQLPYWLPTENFADKWKINCVDIGGRILLSFNSLGKQIYNVLTVLRLIRKFFIYN